MHSIWQIFVPGFIEIPPVHTEISRHAKWELPNRRRTNRRASRWISVCRKSALGLATTLSFDLLHWKLCQQFPLTWRICDY